MEAPLGASALMHSSTLVIAGIVLLFKLSFIIELSNYATILMFFLGCLSAFFGSFFACFQFELKTILAYSTISNCGILFFSIISSDIFTSLIFFIFHGFFKSISFILVGYIIYLYNHKQDFKLFIGFIICLINIYFI